MKIDGKIPDNTESVDYSFYANVIDDINLGVYFVDSERQITFWNRGAEAITGFRREDIINKHCHDNILNHINENGEHLCIGGCPLGRTIEDGQKRNAVVYLHHKDGYRVKVSVKTTAIYNDGKIIGAAEVFERMSEKEVKKFGNSDQDKEYSMDELRVLALYDQLTGIPNRRYLESILKTKFMEWEMLQMNFGVIFIDIDNFRYFNNMFGHDVGDKVLKVVTNTLTTAIKRDDVIGRWGGEEFVGIFPASSEDNLKDLCEKLRFLVENSVLREGNKECHVTISIGATLVKEGDTMENVVKRADEAMYTGKSAGKNTVVFV